MGGRPRTPTAVLDARGSFKNHAGRKREGEPVVTEPIGAAPERLLENELIAWNEVIDCAPLGVLTQADRHHVEELSKALAQSWEQGQDCPATVRGLINKMLGQLGMNPSDRSRISIPKAKKANGFAGLDNK